MSLGWPEVALGDCVAPVRTTSPATKFGDREFDYIDVGAVDQRLKAITNPTRLSGGAAPSRARQLVAAGDVLVSTVRPNLNAVARVGRDLDGAIGSTGFTVLRPTERLDGGYLFHWVRTRSFISTMERRATGASYPAVSDRIVRESRLPLPPLDEQKRIARILDVSDRLRMRRTRAQTLTQSLERAVFARAIRDGIASRRMRVGDIAEILTGFPFRSAEFTEAGVRLCRGANVLPGRLDWSDLRCWPSVDDPRLHRYVLGSDDIVLAMDRPWISTGFKIARVGDHDLPALLVQRVARLRADPAIVDQRFLFAALNSVEFQRHCRPTETTIPHISPEEIRGFFLSVPALREQREAAEVSRRIETIALRQAEQMNQLDTLFASLQHRAFTGEL